MRYYNTFKDHVDEDEVARIASRHAEHGIDSYSNYGVGAALVVSHDHDQFTVYGGFNVNLTGMQTKIHAEQMALMDFVADTPHYEDSNGAVELRMMAVNTTDGDMAFRCGHCLQVASAVCEHFGFDKEEFLYGAVAEHEDGWATEMYPRNYLMPETYTEVRKKNGS